MTTIVSKFANVHSVIAKAAERVGRNPADVALIAVTKTVPSERVQEAIVAGATICGENRIQEARGKIESIGHGVKWHLIGHLQTNKVKYVFGLFDCIHSVDSVHLAQEIDKRAQLNKTIMDILIQVNVSEEESKFGTSKDSLVDLIKDISKLPHVSIKGLMTIPPFSLHSEDSRVFFKELVSLQQQIIAEGIDNVSMDELSMGMSGDYGVAVEEGATMVRVGSAIFGERDYA